MRKFIAAGTLAALGVAALVVPALSTFFCLFRHWSG